MNLSSLHCSSCKQEDKTNEYSFICIYTSELVEFNLKTFHFKEKRIHLRLLSFRSVAGSNPFAKFNYVLSEMEVAIFLMQLAP